MANSASSNELHSITKHNNIVISGVGSNEILKFDGSNWINQTLAESGIAALSGAAFTGAITGVTALTVDNININGNTISSTAGTDLLITPLGGQQLILDTNIIIDAGAVTGATSITSTQFVGGGVGLTALVAGNITSGGTFLAQNGSALTALNGTQITSGTLPVARIGADSIVEGKLNVSNGPTNGQVLTARDGVAGGFTWEAAASGGVDTTGTPANNQIATFTDADTLNGESNLLFTGSILLVNQASVASQWMTKGITINQLTDDNEAFCVKSSDIAHGVNTAETSSYFTIRKSNPGSGGAMLTGYIEAGDYAGIQLRTYVIDANGTKSASGAGSFNLTAYHGTDGGPLNDSANANIAIFRAGNTHTRFIFDVEGTGFADDSWTTYSDGRLKFNQEVIPYGLDALMQLQPKVYEKDSGYLEDGVPVLEGKRNRQIGFVAQEVKEIIPEVIKDIDADSWYSLEDGKLMAVVVKAIQELKAEVDALKS